MNDANLQKQLATLQSERDRYFDETVVLSKTVDKAVLAFFVMGPVVLLAGCNELVATSMWIIAIWLDQDRS